MAGKTGLQQQLGIAAESTVGTYVAPTRFIAHESESLALSAENHDFAGRQPGQLAQQGAFVVQTTRAASGDLVFAPLSKGAGLWLNTLHGATVTPTVTTSPAYLQAHPIGLTAPDGRSLTVQCSEPSTDGTANVKTMLGAVPSAVEFSVDTGGVLMATLSLEGTDLDDTRTLASATYPTSPEVFGFSQATVLVGGASPGIVKSTKVKLTFPRELDRYGLAGGATRAEPIVNGFVTLDGSFTMEFDDLIEFDAFKADTRRTYKLTCLGIANIATSTKAKFEIDIPSIQTLAHTPMASDGSIIKVEVPFRGLITSTNPLCTINYVSLDVAL